MTNVLKGEGGLFESEGTAETSPKRVALYKIESFVRCCRSIGAPTDTSTDILGWDYEGMPGLVLTTDWKCQYRYDGERCVQNRDAPLNFHDDITFNFPYFQGEFFGSTISELRKEPSNMRKIQQT